MEESIQNEQQQTGKNSSTTKNESEDMRKLKHWKHTQTFIERGLDWKKKSQKWQGNQYQNDWTQKFNNKK